MIRSFMKKCILPTVLLLLSLVSFGQIPKNYNCYRATTKVIIDGNVYEDVWKETPWSDFFVDITGDTLLLPYYQTRMKMLWDESYLYVAAEMEDSNIWSYLENHDDIIYRDNDFEVFLDPDGDGLNYYEIEINALGTVLDLFMKKPYNRGGSADLKWNASGIKKAIKIYGHINDDSIEGEELSHSAVEESDQIIEEKVEEPSVDKSSADDTPIQDELKNEEPAAQTAYDLFSTTSDNAIAKQFTSDEDQSVGEKMQKTQVENIREAIGINEKFLFINELFNGDMTRYNKILDEINEFTTSKGVETYILELKVQSQWGDDNEAYHKLKELCERKLNQ